MFRTSCSEMNCSTNQKDWVMWLSNTILWNYPALFSAVLESWNSNTLNFFFHSKRFAIAQRQTKELSTRRSFSWRWTTHLLTGKGWTSLNGSRGRVPIWYGLGGVHVTPLLTDRQTDRTQNITFPQTTYAGGKNTVLKNFRKTKFSN